jgi:hypothetical protein
MECPKSWFAHNLLLKNTYAQGKKEEEGILKKITITHSS